MRFLFLSLTCLFLAGCRHQPVAGLAYKLIRQGETPVLLPPVTQLGMVKIPKARREAPKMDCSIPGSVVSLQWQGKTAQLRLAAAQELSDAENRPYAAATEALENFRNAVTSAFEKGCYTSDEAKRLLAAAAEHFALPSFAAFGLRYGGYAQSGYVDITPEFLLEVVSPLPTGFEIAHYGISDGHVRLLTAGPSVSQEWMKFPDVALYFRLVFLISKSAADHDAILLGAPTRDALARATAVVQAQPEEACGATGANYVCALVPARSALNPQFPVVANGTVAYIALGGTVRELINPRGPRITEAPNTLRVFRAFGGQKIPVTYEGPEILTLVLLPGDELTW